MNKLKKIIELESEGREIEAENKAVYLPHMTWCLYLEYKCFCDKLDELLNKNFIL